MTLISFPLFISIFITHFSLAQKPFGQPHPQHITTQDLLHESERNLLDVIKHDVFAPPVANRIYTYANIAFYECMRLGYKDDYASLVHQINGLDSIPNPPNKNAIEIELVAFRAFWEVGKALVFSTDSAEKYEHELLERWRPFKSPQIYDASIAYGDLVAQTIIQLAKSDNYSQTRIMSRYMPKSKEGYWNSSPPDYTEALEPNWQKIKPLVLKSANECKPPLPSLFSLDTTSIFWKETMEVYNSSQQLDSEKIKTALYWDDNPFTTVHAGHVIYSIKKYSPGAHWLLITQQALKQTDASIMQCAQVYTLVSIAMFDGFISCWDEKYRSEKIRPVTVINQNINVQWEPLIQTPPFPEYTSGHSVTSASAAAVLTKLFGENFSFSDSTEKLFGMEARKFTSFKAAAQQASISRFYGGIHFMSALDEGAKQGNRVGELVVERIKLLK
ncbi:MAG: vanadium-dependent haloperoxidase [Chitinophagales bacterium]|nr:vanadium-dependent haloperoxidase [Chitinophagales bacterium]